MKSIFLTKKKKKHKQITSTKWRNLIEQMKCTHYNCPFTFFSIHLSLLCFFFFFSLALSFVSEIARHLSDSLSWIMSSNRRVYFCDRSRTSKIKKKAYNYFYAQQFFFFRLYNFTFGNSVSSANALAYFQWIWNNNFGQHQLQHKFCYDQKTIAKNTYFQITSHKL